MFDPTRLQVVRAANGEVHAFAVEADGVWQFQRNLQSRRWQRLRAVPGIAGVSQLQALLVPELWPSPGDALQPGLVLAYRVGDGDKAQIQASLARWDDQGQLLWSAPVPLGSVPSRVQAFSLGLSADGTGFSLETRRQPRGDASGGSEPVATLVRVAGANPAQPELIDGISGTTLAALTPAEPLTFASFTAATGAPATAPAPNRSLTSLPATPVGSGDSTANGAVIATALVLNSTPLSLQGLDNGLVLRSAATAAAANNPAAADPLPSFGSSQVIGSFSDSSGNSNGWLAIAQPFTTSGSTPTTGQVWLQYTGQSSGGVPSSNSAQAPSTWLTALAQSRFSGDTPNQPLRDASSNASSSGGLLIRADASQGWGQSFGQTMLVVDVNGDGVLDLVIAAPDATGGGRVVIINGTWIKTNLTSSSGVTTLDLSDPGLQRSAITVLTPSAASSSDDLSSAGFGGALAFDPVAKTLWIGASGYARQLNPGGSNPQMSLQPIGAVYSYSYAANGAPSWGQATATPLAVAAVGSGGITVSSDASGSPVSTYWGSRFGSAIAANGSGGLAVSAPGLQASLLYGNGSSPSSPSNDGALQQIQLPGGGPFSLFGSIVNTQMTLRGPANVISQLQVGDQVTGGNVAAGTTITAVLAPTSSSGGYVTGNFIVSQANSIYNATLTVVPQLSTTLGDANPLLQTVANATNQGAADSSAMQNLRALQGNPIVVGDPAYNPVSASAAVGAVYLFNASGDLRTLGGGGANPINALAVAQASGGGASFYGPNPWNTQGDTGFGGSLSFADLINSNTQSILAIGSPLAGGSGALYLVNTQLGYTAAPSQQSSGVNAVNLGSNQYLAYLASGVSLYGAASGDNFGNGLLSLGDVNQDGYGDLLIQAYEAASGAGQGYVLFGADQLLPGTSANAGGPNLTSGSVAPAVIGRLQRAEGATILAPILSQLGSGQPGYTGQGNFGAGDVNGDGIPDIPLGSGPNGSAYVTWGSSSLGSTSGLQLNLMASDRGMVLSDQASVLPGSLQSIGDFNGDGLGDAIAVLPGEALTTVELFLGQNSQSPTPSAAFRPYSFTVANGTQVLGAGDMNGDGYTEIALFLDQNLSATSQGAGSTTGILFGRPTSQLPASSGFGLQAPVGPSIDGPQQPLPGTAMGSMLSGLTPSVVAVGNTLYAAVQGQGTSAGSIYFSQSRDGGNTWSTWTDLTSLNAGFNARSATPASQAASLSLAFHQGQLYLGFVNSGGDLCLASWNPASGNPADWSAPTAIASASDSSALFWSNVAPQLLDQGNALGMVWVDGPTGQLRTAQTSTPATSLPWSPVGTGASVAAPALAQLGNILYMAVQAGSGGNLIYWTRSGDGGASWAPWSALPSTMTSNAPPSLAVVNDTLYLSYLSPSSNAINITAFNTVNNTWNPSYQISGQSAHYATLCSETVAGTQQLAVYYVSNDSTSRLLKTYSSTPSSSSGWSSDQLIDYNNGSGQQTASGPIVATQLNGQTYLAYQGGTINNSSTTIYLATSSSSAINNGKNWTAQALLDPGTRTGLGLSSSGDGLTLTYGNSSASSVLQVSQLTPVSTSTVSVQTPTSLPLPVGLSNTISAIASSSGSGRSLLLAGINNPANNNAVQTSLVDLGAICSWSTPASLQQGGGSPIAATGACSAAWLGGQLVLAVNELGAIQVYAASAGSNTLQLVSSFSFSDGVTLNAIPELSRTPTGLVLTYNNASGGITLNRLDLFQPNGTPLPGAPVNSDGSLETSAGDLTWQTSTLTTISTDLGSVPVSVNGTLLLANVRDAAADQANQVWLNAVPAANDPSSAIWLNSTVQLPTSSGAWTISQQSGTTINLGTTLPGWQTLSADKVVQPPAYAFDAKSGVIYAASVDVNNHLWWCSSSDGGASWSAAQELPTSMTTEVAPGLGILNGRLYLAYVGTNQQINITSLDLSYANNTWASVYQISNQSAQTISMVNEELNSTNKLAIYYLGTNNNIYRTVSKNNDPASTDWVPSQQIPNQTASGQIVATRLASASTTYIAYPGGTPDNPSSTIYLSGSNDPGSNSSWWVTSNIPQPTHPASNGVTVGLTNNSSGLILSYADLSSQNLPVLVLQQATVSGSSTSWSPYTTLQSPSLSPRPAASVFATPASTNVLVSVANTGNSWTGVDGGASPNTPALARQSVDVVLSDTVNYALGTGSNAGQVLLTPAGVSYYNQNNKTLPAFSLSPLSGSEFPSSLTVTPVVIQTSQSSLPSLTITPVVLTTAPAANQSVASFTVSASSISQSVSLALSDPTNYALGTGSNEGQVLLTAAGATYYSQNKTLPAFTLTPSYSESNNTDTSNTGTGDTGTSGSNPINGSAVRYTPLIIDNTTQAATATPTLKLSAFNTPIPSTSKTGPTAWSPVASFNVAGASVNTVYMAVQGNNNQYVTIGGEVYDIGDYLYWTSSNDNGNSWASWQQLPSSITTLNAPSLAMVGGRLYLSYLDPSSQGIYITYLENPQLNTWSTPYQIPSQSASNASLIAENNQGTQVLSVYYVSNDSSSRLLKTYSSTPTSSSGWSTLEPLQYGDSSDQQLQTASGPLVLSQLNGQTTIAYQGGTTASPSGDVYLTSSANPFDGTSWVVQKLQLLSDPPSKSSLGLSGNGSGLTLSYGTSANPDQLQLNQYTASNTPWSNLLQASSGMAALAWDGRSTAYSAVISSGALYWTSGSQANSTEAPNDAFAWNDWRPVNLPTGTGLSDQPPSLVLLNGVVTLSYIDSNQAINIISLTNASSNTWSSPYQLPSATGAAVTASQAVLAAEPVGMGGSGSSSSQTQLAVYYLPPGNGSSPLSKAYSLTPSVNNSWTTGMAIGDQMVSTDVPDFRLQATQYQGQTYLLYPLLRNGEYILTTSPEPNNPKAWASTVQFLGGPAAAGSGIAMSGGADGLAIGYINSNCPSNLQLQRLQPQAPSWETLSASTATPIALAGSGSSLLEVINATPTSPTSLGGIEIYIGGVYQTTLPVGDASQVSAAVLDNVAYVSYIVNGNVYCYFSQIAANDWKETELPVFQALSAVLCPETIAGQSQLALYYVCNDGTNRIFKTYSTSASPSSFTDWTSPVPLTSPNASGEAIPLTCSSSLSATQHDGRTYLAFQGGSGAATDTAISLLTSATPNAWGSWSNAYSNLSSVSPSSSPADPGQVTQISLFGSAAGLALCFGSSAEPTSLQTLLITPSTTPWSSQNAPSGAAALGAPVQLINGASIYSVVRDSGTNKLWYSSSSNSGKTWTSWAAIAGCTSAQQPSLALLGTTLYLGYLDNGQITITYTTNPTSPSGPKWTSGGTLAGPSASALQLLAEPCAGSTQLAVYSVSADGSGQISKAFSSDPSSTTPPATWVTGLSLASEGGTTPLICSDPGSFSAAVLGDQTYLAFQDSDGDTTVATSPIANNGLYWGTQTLKTAAGISQLDLITSASGLNLSYLTGQGSEQQLQIDLLGQEQASWSSPLNGTYPSGWVGQATSTDGSTTTEYDFTAWFDTVLYWRAKTDNAGSISWSPWQRLSAANFGNWQGDWSITGQPSVAVLDGTVYLAFINQGAIWLTSLTNPANNIWSDPYRIGSSTGLAASAIALVNETVLTSTGAGTGNQTLGSTNQQLAVYFISGGGNGLSAGQIGKTYSLSPTTNAGWSNPLSLAATAGNGRSTPLSGTDSLQACQLDGQTYLTYLTQTAGSNGQVDSHAIVLATTANGLSPGTNTPSCNSSTGWSTQAVVDFKDGNVPLGPIVLSSGANGVNVGYRVAGQAGELVVDAVGVKSPTWISATTFQPGATGSPAALACAGNTVYMALQTGDSLFWSTSLDGGTTWDSWQQVPGVSPATQGGSPSLAVMNGTLYLEYLDASNAINVMANPSPGANIWSRPYRIPSQQASYASLISETIGSKTQLAIYYVNPTNSGVEKTYSTNPTYSLSASASTPSWSKPIALETGSGSSAKAITSTGPLGLAQVNGQTYLAYQGDSSPDTTLTLTANAGSSNYATGWQKQTLNFNNGGISGSGLNSFSLSGGAQGLSLTAIAAGLPTELQGQLLTPKLSNSALSLTPLQSASQTLPDGISSVASVNGQLAGANTLILAGIPSSSTALAPYASSIQLASTGLSQLAAWNAMPTLSAGPSGTGAALASSGTLFYMAAQSGDQLYWASSGNGGTTWTSWEPVVGANPAADGQPSLAVVNGTLYLSYLDANNVINITANSNPQFLQVNSNSWSTPYQIPGQTASAASLISETVGTTNQLSLYFVNPSTAGIEKTYTTNPSGNPPSWSSPRALQFGSGASATPLTSAGPLSVCQLNGQTYLAFQGSSAADGTITIAANPNTNNTVTNWQRQNLTLGGGAAVDSFNLNGNASGLTLSVTSAGRPDLLQAVLLSPQLSSSDLNLTVLKTTNQTLPDGLNNVTALFGQATYGNDLILASIPTSNASLSAITSQVNPWSAPLQLQSSTTENLERPPAVVHDGNTVYMAVHAVSPGAGGQPSDGFFWSTSSDGGRSWSSWQQVGLQAAAGAAPAKPQQPSLALVDGTLVLGFVDERNTINITSLSDPANSNSWSAIQQLAGQPAESLSLCLETIPTSSGASGSSQSFGRSTQLAAYYTSPSSHLIYKTFSTDPSSSASWSPAVALASVSGGSSTPLTARGPLSVSQVNGQTYLAYTVQQPGSSGVPGGGVVEIATAANGFSLDGGSLVASVNSGSAWSRQAITSLSQQGAVQGQVSLSGNGLGLQLGYGLASQPNALQISLVTPATTNAGWSALTAPGGSGLASGTAALALSGTTLYLAVQVGGALYWTSSSNGGSSWGSWQAVNGATPGSQGQPSLAVVGGSLYLGYLDASGAIQICANSAPASGNSWSAPAIIAAQPAASAFSLLSETIGGKSQLSVYSIAVSSSNLLKAYSTNPSAATPTWTSGIALKAGSGGSATPLTASSLSAAQIGNQTYLAYQASGSGAITIATTNTSTNNAGTGWLSQSLVPAGGASALTGYSLNGSSSGLTLSTLSSSQPGLLQAALLAPQTSASALTLTLQQSTTLGLPAGLTGLASLTDPLSASSSNLVLAGINSGGQGGGNSSPSVATTALVNPWSPNTLAIQQTTSQRLPQNMNGDGVALLNLSSNGSANPQPLLMVGSQYTEVGAQIQTGQVNPWNPALPVVLSTTPTLPTSLGPASTAVVGQSSSTVLTLVGSGAGSPLQSNAIDGFTGPLSNLQQNSISLPSTISNSSVSVRPTPSTSLGSTNQINLVLAGSNPSATPDVGSAVQNSTIASPWTPSLVQDPNGSASPSTIGSLGNIALINTSAKNLLVTAININSSGGIASNASVYSNLYNSGSANSVVSQVPGSASQYLGPNLRNTNIAILSVNNSSDAANSNSQALIGAGINSTAAGNLVQTSLFTPSGSQVKSVATAVVQERPASITLGDDDRTSSLASGALAASQTSSTLIPVGDLNRDGYADLLVTANNVVVQTGANTQSLGTGLRLISGAGNSSLILQNNDPNQTRQTVQVASPFNPRGSTPVAALTGAAQLTLSSLGPSQSLAGPSNVLGLNTYALTSMAGANGFEASNLATAYNLFLQGATPSVEALSLQTSAALSRGNTSTGFGDLNGDGWLDYLSSDPDQSSLFDASGKAWQVWSVRAAGDVNGNGADDVLLTLLPSEKADQLLLQYGSYLSANADGTLQQKTADFIKSLQLSLQPVLLDGALFNVTNSHTFSLTDLRVPLNPDGGNHDQQSQTVGLPAALTNQVAMLAGLGNAQQDVLLAGANGSGIHTCLAELLSSWSDVDRLSSLGTPSLVQVGNTVYMAVQGGPGDDGNAQSIHWTFSTDGGAHWQSWRTIPSQFNSGGSVVLANTSKPPSLAVLNNQLYLLYVQADTDDLYLTSLNVASPSSVSTNSWSTPYQIPLQSATYATLTTQTVTGVPQLAVYYVSADSSNRILEAYSNNPSAASPAWTTDQQIYYDYNASSPGNGIQTASGPIAVAQYNGKTYLAYQGGTTANPLNEIYIATSGGNPNNGQTWTTQALLNPGGTTGLGLTAGSEGLNLSYSTTTQSDTLQISLLTPSSAGVTLAQTSSQVIPAGLSNNVTLLFHADSNGSNPRMLLAGINKAASGNLVQTTVVDPWSEWNPLSTGFTPAATPALARADDLVYMAAQVAGTNRIQWTSSSDGGSTWMAWQEVPGTISASLPAGGTAPLSLAVFNGRPYLSFITSNQSVAITALTNGVTNSWSAPVIPSGTAGSAACLSAETVNGLSQLALYTLSNNTILKAYSGTPANGASWTTNQAIFSSSGSGQTASGSLVASQYLGQTYLAYQGGTAANPSTMIYLATSPSANSTNGSSWTAQAISDPGIRTSLSLSGSARGLLLSRTTAAQPQALTITNLASSQAPSTTLDPLQNWISGDSLPGSLAGSSIDGNVDLNGDGLSDVLISQPAAINGSAVSGSNPSGRNGSDANAGSQYALFGGDLLGIATQMGTPSNDSLNGTAQADVIYSLQGNDQVGSMGGVDVIYTGSGDDTIAIIDNGFLRIDGGSGFNTLLLQGQPNQSYDFRLNVSRPQYFCGTKLRNINLISSLGDGVNTLSFDAAAVNALNSDRVLFLAADPSDTINLSAEFSRNSALDASFQGLNWSAYSTGGASSSASTHPTLIYVLDSSGGNAASTLLNQRVSIQVTPGAAESPTPATSAAPSSNPAVSPGSSGVNPSPQDEVINSIRFGAGLILQALKTPGSAGVARFRVVRSDTSSNQLIGYCSSSANASSALGQAHDAVMGLVRLPQGVARVDITVPLTASAITAQGNPTFSLSAQEIPDSGQSTFDLLLRPNANAQGLKPVLSGLQLQLDPSGRSATLQCRADTTSAYRAAPQELAFTLIQRAAADAPLSADDRLQTLTLKDGSSGAYDQDRTTNRQIQVQFNLSLDPSRAGIALKSAGGAARDLLLDILLEPVLTPTPDHTLFVGDPSNDSPASLRLQGTLQGLTTTQVVEIGYVSLRPGETAASLLAGSWSDLQSRGQTIFSTLDRERPNVLPADLSRFSSSISIKNHDQLYVYAVNGCGLSDLSSSSDGRLEWLIPTASNQNATQVSYESRSGAGFRLNLVNSREDLNTLIADQQDRSPVLDLSAFGPSQTIYGSLSQGREAGYDSSISFYRCLDADGSVLDVSGKRLLPGDPGYAQAALRSSNLCSSISDLKLANNGTSTQSFSLIGGGFAAPVAFVNDGDRNRTYFAFAAANRDRYAHFATFGSNCIGLEDMWKGGDNDKNDRLINFQFTGVE